MRTQCNAEQLQFSCVERRRVVAAFDGGTVSSDAGALLLGKADAALGLMDRLAGCFIDERNPELIEHTVRTLIGQRVFGMALGYEDLNDHESLRHDPVFGALLGKLEPKRRADCAALAGKSTLNRLEHAPAEAGPTRYHKITHDGAAIAEDRGQAAQISGPGSFAHGSPPVARAAPRSGLIVVLTKRLSSGDIII